MAELVAIPRGMAEGGKGIDDSFRRVVEKVSAEPDRAAGLARIAWELLGQK